MEDLWSFWWYEHLYNICIHIYIYMSIQSLFIDTVVVWLSMSMCKCLHICIIPNVICMFKNHICILQIDIHTYVYINTTYAFKLQFKESISLIYILMYLQPWHMEFFHKTFFLLRGGRAKKSLKLDVFFKMFYHLNVVFLEHFFDSRTSNLLPLYRPSVKKVLDPKNTCQS